MFGITKRRSSITLFAETCDCSHCRKIRGFAHTTVGNFFAFSARATFLGVLGRYRVGASIVAPCTTPRAASRRQKVARRAETDPIAWIRSRQEDQASSRAERRLASRGRRGDRLAVLRRRSTPRFSPPPKRRLARRDERPRALVRAPRRRSVASPARASPPARLAARGRPRARSIGRSVRRPLERPRRSARSRSEARGEPTRRSRSPRR